MRVNRPTSMKMYVKIMLILIGIVFVFPLILQCPCMNKLFSWFVSGMERAQYKEAYIGVWGGIVGSTLGVLGAVMVQIKSDEHHRFIKAKQNATIIYYDMLFFYNEISSFAVLLLENDNWNKKNVDKLIRCKRPIIISDDWIRVVACMSGVFEKDDWIHTAYQFYAQVIDIQHLMETPSSILSNRVSIQNKLRLIGQIKDGRYTWYKNDAWINGTENVDIGPILLGLKTLVDA